MLCEEPNQSRISPSILEYLFLCSEKVGGLVELRVPSLPQHQCFYMEKVDGTHLSTSTTPHGGVQGYLTDKKTPIRRALQLDHA